MEMKRALTSRSTEQRPLRGGRLAQRPRRYRVRILGIPPADLADQVARLHAEAIRGRDEASELSAVLVGPDVHASEPVRRTDSSHK